MLIVFEGIDGTGKTTQVALLAEYLRNKGFDVVETREPTDGVHGQKIRALYRDRDSVTREEELRLFIEDRRDHVLRVVGPALKAGQIVITDRYYLSTAAYQGAAGMNPEMIMRENEAFAPEPDLVLLLTATPATGIDRVQTGRGEVLNDFEKAEYLQLVAGMFEGLQREYIRKIDAQRPVEDVHRNVMVYVDELMRKKTSCRVNHADTLS